MNKIISISLWAIVLILAFVLYKTIQEPIQYEKEYQIREKKTVSFLKNIRDAQKAYYQVHGKFAGNWDSLIYTLKNDTIITLKRIGDPEDSTVQSYIEKIPEPVLTTMNWEDGLSVNDVAELRYVPFSDGEEFKIQAGEIERQRIVIQAFEVSATKDQYLKGIPKKYKLDKKDLRVGSIEDGNDAGNWE